jgi:predicted nucleotidyltransferase
MTEKRGIKEIEHILPRVRQILERIYGERLRDVVLYGSFARNTPSVDSDIDVAVVLEGAVDKPKEIDRIYDTLYDLMVETGEVVSVYPLSEEEAADLTWPLHYHIKHEGRPI